MEEEACRVLTAAGFNRYEISNYCCPGHACRHNRLYWEGGDYLGIGPSAQSYVSGDRFGNVEDLKVYQDMLTSGRLPTADSERLSSEQQHREAIVFGLRLTEGIPGESVQGQRMDTDWKARLDQLLNDGWLEETEGRIRMTATGRRFADSVAIELL
jgi:oxygen-independent coproporphyrinogen III oxidase